MGYTPGEGSDRGANPRDCPCVQYKNNDQQGNKTYSTEPTTESKPSQIRREGKETVADLQT